MQATERRYSLLFLIGLFFLLFWSASDYGGRYLHVQTISQVLTAGLTLMLSLQMLRQKDTTTLLEYPLLKPVLLFLLVLGMSWIFSVNRLASLEEVWRWVMYCLVSLYSVISKVLTALSSTTYSAKTPSPPIVR